MSVVWPGSLMVMLPPQEHMHCPLSNRAGINFINSFPQGAQGVTVTGMQGMGVSTPQAAEVADATMGFVNDLHIPKGSMFTMGTKSMMVALGFFCIRGRKKSVMTSFDGVVPKEHCIEAPMQTYLLIVFT